MKSDIACLNGLTACAESSRIMKPMVLGTKIILIESGIEPGMFCIRHRLRMFWTKPTFLEVKK